MKSIASAIIVFSGCLLWASGMFAVTLSHMYQGNIGAGEMATWGGIGVTVVGLVLFLVAIAGKRDTP
jgi:hypothetical protein